MIQYVHKNFYRLNHERNKTMSLENKRMTQNPRDAVMTN